MVYTQWGSWRGDCVGANAQLIVGDYLTNDDQTQALQLQSNGDLCTFSIHSPVVDNAVWNVSWCAGVNNTMPSHLMINNKDGTLNLVSQSGYVYWQVGQLKETADTNFFLRLQMMEMLSSMQTT